MRLRRLLPLSVVLAVVATLAIVKVAQIRSLIRFGAAAKESGPPPEAVASAVAQREDWATTLKAVGSVATTKGITLSNEVAGVVTKIHFASGAVVKRGDVLLELDANVENAQLHAAIARRDLAETTLVRTRALVSGGALAATQLDADQAGFDVAKADISSLVAQIARKLVRAPLDGKLGIVLVNPGQYLSPGTSLAVIEATAGNYVDFTLPQQESGKVAAGVQVRLAISGASGAASDTLGGAVEVIDPNVDPIARALRLRARADDPAGKLKPGMFIDVAVVLPETRAVVTVPVTAVVRAAYGDSVFVLDGAHGGGPPAAGSAPKGEIARQQFVRLGELRGDFVVVEQGLAAGQRVVSAGAFKLRNGARVTIDPGVQVHPQAEPRPENR